MHRLKSEIWVAALLRRCQAEGKYGAVIHKGAVEAGAIYVIINHLDGTFHLLGPAPGPAQDEEGERRFILEHPSASDWQTVNAIMLRRRKSDSDLWAVEIEDRFSLAGITPEHN